MEENLQTRKQEHLKHDGDSQAETDEGRLAEGYKRIEIWLSPVEVAQLEFLQEYNLFGDPQKFLTGEIFQRVQDFLCLTKRQKRNRKMEKIPFPPYGQIVFDNVIMDEEWKKQHFENY